MQPVTRENLEQTIAEAKAAGKDVSELERTIEALREELPPMGQKITKITEGGITVIESTGPAREEDFEEVVNPAPEVSISTTVPVAKAQTVNEQNVVQLFSTGRTPQELIGTGVSYRHDWGNFKGQVILPLNWGFINKNTRVFVSIAEGAAGGGKFIGGARFTVHNVAPRDGGVNVWVNIEWHEPLRLYVDYLAIN
jgi:hypothetical protein